MEYLVADSDHLGDLTISTPRQMEQSLRRCARDWETDWADAMTETVPLSVWVAANPNRVERLLRSYPISRNAIAAIHREVAKLRR